MASNQERDDLNKAYGRLFAWAWSDDEFKQRLTSDPAAALKEHGIDVPERTQMQVHDAGDATMHVVLPPKPAELSDEVLSQVAGGTCTGCYSAPETRPCNSAMTG